MGDFGMARWGGTEYSIDRNVLERIVRQGYESWNERSALDPALLSVLSGAVPFALAPNGRIAQRALDHFDAIGLRPVAFCDRGASGSSEAVGGIPLLAYGSLAEKFPEAVLLICTALHDSAIFRSALESGVSNVVGYADLVRYREDVFANREYAGVTRSVFAEGALDAILELFDVLCDDESRRVLLSKVFYYLTFEKRILSSIMTPHVIYFDPSVIDLIDGEVVLDAGAFTGDTLRSFQSVFALARYSYYAFEPDPIAYMKMVAAAKTTGGDEVLVFENLGLGSIDGYIDFAVGGVADSVPVVSSRALEGGVGIESVHIVRADDYFEHREKPSIVKIDVEGFEREVLEGASRLLARQRPTVAISAYHFARDLWEIPLLVHGAVGGGDLYLRHYTSEIDDTVCYLTQNRQSG